VPLGTLYTGGIKDLAFSFHLMGDAAGSTGRVLYEAFSASNPGDFDGDGDVDGRDFLLWQRNTAVGNLVDWQNNYGFGGPLTAHSVVVPEPGAAGCVLIAMVLVTAVQSRSSLNISANRVRRLS
jgi:hypothetical protein